MSIRKRDDSVKPGKGVDGSEGENFTKQNRTDPWNRNPRGNFISRDGGRYTNNESGLRNKPQGAGTGDTHDIFDNVERNSDEASKTGGLGSIKYGVG